MQHIIIKPLLPLPIYNYKELESKVIFSLCSFRQLIYPYHRDPNHNNLSHTDNKSSHKCVEGLLGFSSHSKHHCYASITNSYQLIILIVPTEQGYALNLSANLQAYIAAATFPSNLESRSWSIHGYLMRIFQATYVIFSAPFGKT